MLQKGAKGPARNRTAVSRIRTVRLNHWTREEGGFETPVFLTSLKAAGRGLGGSGCGLLHPGVRERRWSLSQGGGAAISRRQRPVPDVAKTVRGGQVLGLRAHVEQHLL